MNRNQAAFLPLAPPADESADKPVESEDVRQWFGDEVAIRHYIRAATSVSLWRSERSLFTQLFAKNAPLLDVGCGAGRIGLGLWQLGFSNVVGVDFCPAMIAAARELAQAQRAGTRFELGDATNLGFADKSYAGAIFGFNGLMQIPGRASRRRALTEIRRVLIPGSAFVFTSHDRELPAEREWWSEEERRWSKGTQSAQLRELGDRVFRLPEGVVFMHLPTRQEVLDDLVATGWRYEFDELRSRIANETSSVREFADECRFWIVRAG